jgi:hypothetical protein
MRRLLFAIVGLAAGFNRQYRKGCGSSLLARIQPGRMLLLALVVLAFSSGVRVPVAVAATTWTVTNANDIGLGSLRDTIDNVAASGDTIDFSPGLSGASITLMSGKLSIYKDLTIVGPVGGLTVDGGASSQVLYVHSGVTAVISGLTIRNGSADWGGGVQNNGALTLNTSSVIGNAANRGGGISNWSVLILTDSIVGGNSAAIDGGGIENFGLSAMATINHSSVSNNTAVDHGGGIHNQLGTVILNSSTVSGNIVDSGGPSGVASGGGIYNGGCLGLICASSVAILTDSTVGDNSAQFLGGGIRNSGGEVTLIRSTVARNTARLIGGGGVSTNAGAFTVTNSTVSDNWTAGGGPGGGGGGIQNTGGGTVTLDNSTVSNNTSPAGNGGGIKNAATATANNTIIANNSDDCSGSLNSGGYNLIENTTGCAIGGNTIGNITGIDPILGPLALNPPGSTETRALCVSVACGGISPAINEGGDCPPPATDQRGVARPQGSSCDIGAYEAEIPPSCTITVTKETVIRGGASTTPFSFVISSSPSILPTSLDFELSDGQSHTVTVPCMGVIHIPVPAPYIVTETPITSPWELEGITCSGSPGAPTYTSDSAQFTMAATGSDVSCTFVNGCPVCRGGIEKVPEGNANNTDPSIPAANLYLCILGPCSGPGEGDLRVVEHSINVYTGDQNGDTIEDGLGAYEFSVEYDNFVIQSVNPCDIVFGPGGAGSSRGPVDEVNASSPANPDCSPDPNAANNGTCAASLIFENVIRFGCVTSGQAPGPTGDFDLASLDLIPHPDLANDIFPGNNNGVVTVLKDNGCELVDVFGHAITGSINGGLTQVCGDLAVTVRILEGDLNLDCKVDVQDEQLMGYRYGSFFGSVLYGRWYDLEPALRDLDIDVKDLQKVFGRDGSTCQNPVPAQTPVPPPVPFG